MRTHTKIHGNKNNNSISLFQQNSAKWFIGNWCSNIKEKKITGHNVVSSFIYIKIQSECPQLHLPNHHINPTIWETINAWYSVLNWMKQQKWTGGNGEKDLNPIWDHLFIMDLVLTGLPKWHLLHLKLVLVLHVTLGLDHFLWHICWRPQSGS